MPGAGSAAANARQTKSAPVMAAQGINRLLSHAAGLLLPERALPAWDQKLPLRHRSARPTAGKEGLLGAKVWESPRIGGKG